jgi:curved DNA-binding protein CbpA
MLSKPAPPSEECELPIDVQVELLALQGRGKTLTHYHVLELSPAVDATAVRAAYISRSKRFHPDSYFGKRLGTFGQLLADTFRRVSEAHAVLADADSRAEYDAAAVGFLDAAGRAAVTQRAEARADEERRASERRRRLFNTKGFAKLGAARRLYEEALEQAERGERMLAIEALKVALQLDPNRAEIAARLSQIEQEVRKSRAFGMVERGRGKEADDQMAEALQAYQAAIRMDPANATAHLGAARAALALHEFATAAALAGRAVEYAPRAAEPKLLLARAQAGLSQRSTAKKTLEALLEQSPDHKEARALLRSL